MSTERLNRSPAILPRVLGERLWGERDFFLIDVGASGGIEQHWRVFGDRLRAIGFEPLVAEAQRLQAEASGSKVEYQSAFVTCRGFDDLFPPELRSNRVASKNNDPFPRVSAIRALELLRVDYTQQMFNAGAPAEYTDTRVVLDDFLPAYKHGTVDFIKVDTDGHDFQVILGADALMRNGGALGLSVEVQFHGASHEYANTFANIDRFLRDRGFSLFDLDVYRYSRAALPAPFVYGIPAQTVSGQVLWGEAVYMRDLGSAEYERMWPSYVVTRERVIKLACLFDLFGLPDCAAELLQTRRAIVGPACDALLDDLAPAAGGTPGAYAEFIRAFEADPGMLYPSRRPETPDLSVVTSPPVPMNAVAVEQTPSAEPVIESPASTANQDAELLVLRERVARLKDKARLLQDRLRRRNEEIAKLRKTNDAPEVRS